MYIEKSLLSKIVLIYCNIIIIIIFVLIEWGQSIYQVDRTVICTVVYLHLLKQMAKKKLKSKLSLYLAASIRMVPNKNIHISYIS